MYIYISIFTCLFVTSLRRVKPRKLQQNLRFGKAPNTNLLKKSSSSRTTWEIKDGLNMLIYQHISTTLVVLRVTYDWLTIDAFASGTLHFSNDRDCEIVRVLTKHTVLDARNGQRHRQAWWSFWSELQLWCNLSFARHPSWDAKRTVCVSAQGYEIIHANTHINQRNGFDWCHLAIHLCHGLPSCEKDGTGNPGLLCYMIGVLVVMSTAYMGNKCNYIDII